jgi:hypothetical protein
MSLVVGVIALSAVGCGDSGNATDMNASVDLAVNPPPKDLAGSPADLTQNGDAGGTTPTCAAYCTAVTANCTGTNQAVTYPTGSLLGTCMSYCTTNAAWTTGMSSDTSGDTLGCHEYHANAAATDPATHCKHAGPSGANTCGAWCEVYCDLAQKNCTGGNQLYASTTACMTACTGAGTGTFIQGTPNATAGNTVQCRIYHLGAAGGSAALATTHCPHGTIPTSAVCTGAPQ